MFEFDRSLTLGINGLAGRSSIVDSFSISLTLAAVPIMVAVVAIRWWRIGSLDPIRHTCLVAGFSLLPAASLNMLIALFVYRIRPNDAGLTHLLIAHSPSASFPSDHAATATAIAAAIWLNDKGKFAVGFVIVASLVCFSRVFIGVHYVSDVIGGVVTGGVAAKITTMYFTEKNKVIQFLVQIL